MRLLITLIACSLFTSCATVATNGPFFPKTTPPPKGIDEVLLTGGFRGRLVIEGGCVRVSSDLQPGTVTVLWNHRTLLEHDARGYYIRNEGSSHRQRFGEVFDFGGGAIHDQTFVKDTYPDVYRSCPPPYTTGWLP